MSELEDKALGKGIRIHYDLLEAAGLKLRDGLCRIRGEYHLFIDRRKSPAARIETIREYVDHPFPENIPENFPAQSPEESRITNDPDAKDL